MGVGTALRTALQALRLGKNLQGPAQLTKLLAPVQRASGSPNFFKQVGNYLSPGENLTAIDKVMRYGPDLAFGGLAALQTEGDAFDKGTAFLTTAGGGLLGGLGTAGTVRHFGKGRIKPQNLTNYMQAADLAGSMLGDYVAYPLGESIMRGKDKLMGGLGETGFERLNRQQQLEYAQAMKQQILSQYGLLPGGRGDDYLRQLGLA